MNTSYKVGDIIKIDLMEYMKTLDDKIISRKKFFIMGSIVEVRVDLIYKDKETVEEVTYALASNIIFVDGKSKKTMYPGRNSYKERVYTIIGKYNEEGKE